MSPAGHPGSHEAAGFRVLYQGKTVRPPSPLPPRPARPSTSLMMGVSPRQSSGPHFTARQKPLGDWSIKTGLRLHRRVPDSVRVERGLRICGSIQFQVGLIQNSLSGGPERTLGSRVPPACGPSACGFNHVHSCGRPWPHKPMCEMLWDTVPSPELPARSLSWASPTAPRRS